jgi:hypothetical protein
MNYNQLCLPPCDDSLLILLVELQKKIPCYLIMISCMEYCCLPISTLVLFSTAGKAFYCY